jgi:hypothetical protein
MVYQHHHRKSADKFYCTPWQNGLMLYLKRCGLSQFDMPSIFTAFPLGRTRRIVHTASSLARIHHNIYKQDFRVFGCPSYVLHKDLQDGHKVSKWNAHSWQGVYVGHSSCHSGSIPLMYNTKTMHISPQYHVIYDEFFRTATGPLLTSPDEYLDRLYHSTARWMYEDNFTDTPYLFDSFWSGKHSPGITDTNPNRRKHKACNAPHSIPSHHPGNAREDLNLEQAPISEESGRTD